MRHLLSVHHVPLLPLLLGACTPAAVLTLDTGPYEDGGSTGSDGGDPGGDSGGSATGGDDGTDSGESEPDELQLSASADRGFYTASFDLALTADVDGATITWTIDGSDPRTSDEAQVETGPVSIEVDPGRDDGRDPAPGFVVRAVAQLDGYADSDVLTHTFLFPARLADLSPHNEPPGEDWPDPYETNSSSSSRHAMDYGIDTRVTEDPAYADLVVDALLAIPSISLSTDLAHLMDEDEGIYLNPMEHGRDWERPVSFEIIDPADSSELQVDAGLRIRGGWSRHPDNPKHAFRLFFRRDYGEGKLEFPLFEDEGVDEFDKVDLRTSQNYSWSYKSTAGTENTLVRDVYARDLQLAMGQASTRSRYYHLYLNGVYWGLYQTQERAEARFAASYFGGEVEDYDVVKVNGDDPTARVIEATDGTLDVWEDIWDRCEEGFSEDAAYYALQGLDSGGVRDESLPVLVDVDNLIDYQLVIFYTGNFDAPTGAFTNNQGPNNFFAIKDREDTDQGFRFFAHDSEHSLLAEAWSPGIGVAEDRVNLGTRTDSYRMKVSDFEDFHPQWLHHKLTDNAQYRARFAERARVWLAADGLMSPSQTQALVQLRADQIQLAIIAESARWGDTKSFSEGGRTWRTRDDDWQPAVDRILDDWAPARREIVISQLEEAGLW